MQIPFCYTNSFSKWEINGNHSQLICYICDIRLRHRTKHETSVRMILTAFPPRFPVILPGPFAFHLAVSEDVDAHASGLVSHSTHHAAIVTLAVLEKCGKSKTSNGVDIRILHFAGVLRCFNIFNFVLRSQNLQLFQSCNLYKFIFGRSPLHTRRQISEPQSSAPLRAPGFPCWHLTLDGAFEFLCGGLNLG